MLQTRQLLGAIPVFKYLPSEQLLHPFAPAREQVAGQLASQL
jgi:hypothetical protein